MHVLPMWVYQAFGVIIFIIVFILAIIAVKALINTQKRMRLTNFVNHPSQYKEIGHIKKFRCKDCMFQGGIIGTDKAFCAKHFMYVDLNKGLCVTYRRTV